MCDPTEARLQLFVDDPCATIRGTPQACDWIVATMILAWRALGFPLSFRKGQRGPKVTWIGAHLEITATTVTAAIKDNIVQDLEEQTVQLLQSNVANRRAVQSYAGRGHNVAALIWTMRPFMQFAWAALASPGEGAPPGCIWMKQVLQSLQWTLAFLRGRVGSLSRTFTVESYLGQGRQDTMAMDASPWGLGAILFEDDSPVSWFASPV